MRCRFFYYLTVLLILFSARPSKSQEFPAFSYNIEKNDLHHQVTAFKSQSLFESQQSTDLDISYSQQLKNGIIDLYSDPWLLYSFTAAGLFANTGIDEQIRSTYYGNIKSSGTNKVAKIVKPLGNGRIMFPSYIAGFLLGKVFKNNGLEEWGKNAFNATLISAPGLLSSQYSLGGSRPYMDQGSKWWTDMDRTNGASGHTWVSAIPFITTAKMTTNKLLKVMLYSASTLTGISRINDNAHYASQVILGYACAYCSVNSIMQNMGNDAVRLNVGQSGLRMTLSF